MTIAWIALGLAVANTAVNVLSWWRGRHRVTAILTPAAAGGGSLDSFTYGVVKVSSQGGTCTVESVSLEWADKNCPKPDNYGSSDPFAKTTATADEIQLMLSTGDFGQQRRVLANGETSGWSRIFTTSDEEAARSFRELRAQVTLGSGKVIHSNTAFIEPVLRPVAAGDS